MKTFEEKYVLRRMNTGAETVGSGGIESNEQLPKENNLDRTSYFPGKGETLADSHNKQVDVKDSIETLKLPTDIVNVLKDNIELKKAGFKFDTKTGNIIVPEGFRNPEAVRQIEEFMRVARWLNSKEATDLEKSNNSEYKSKKVDIYLELTKLDTNVIGLNRKLLEYRYINSIYQDIIDDGFVFQKDENGIFKVINPKTKEKATGEYVQKLLDSKNRNKFDFEFAFISSITNNSAIFNEKGNISQKHTIAAILDKHGIEGKFGEKITHVDVMLLDWDNTIKKQIDNKLKIVADIDTHAYQELTYIKGFIENKDYMKNIQNKELYSELNAYNEADNKVNSLVEELNGAPDERTVMEKTVGALKELAIPVGMIGLILSIFEGTRSIGKALLVGGVGAFIGGKVMGAVSKRVDIQTDEDLGIIIPTKRTYSVENKFRKDYGDAVKRLQKLNNDNKGKERFGDDLEESPALKDNIKLNDIANDILSLKEDPEATMSSSDLFAKLESKAGKKYDKNDVRVFLDLLNSNGFDHDEEDKTIRDYLTEGIDILSKSYEHKGFTESETINENINTILKDVWDNEDLEGSDKKEKRNEVLEIQKTIVSGMSSVNSYIEDVKTVGKNTWNATFGDGEHKSFDKNTVSNNIANIISEIERIDSDGELAKKIKTNLDNYKKYLDIQEKISEFDGVFDSHSINWAKLAKSINWGGIDKINSLEKEEIGNLSIKVSDDIQELNNLKITDASLLAIPEFKELNKKIDSLVKSLEKKHNELGIRYDELVKDEKINGAIGSDTIDTLAELPSSKNLVESFYDEEYVVPLENNISDLHKRFNEISIDLNNDRSLGNVNDLLKEVESIQLSINEIFDITDGVNMMIKDNNGIFTSAQKSILNKIRDFDENKELLTGLIKRNIEQFSDENQGKITELENLDYSDLSKLKESLSKIKEVEKVISFTYIYTEKAKNLVEEVKSLIPAGMDQELADLISKTDVALTTTKGYLSNKVDNTYLSVTKSIDELLAPIKLYLASENISALTKEKLTGVKSGLEQLKKGDVIEGDFIQKVNNVLPENSEVEESTIVTNDNIKVELDKATKEVKKESLKMLEDLEVSEIDITELKDKAKTIKEIIAYKKFKGENELQNLAKNKLIEIQNRYISEINLNTAVSVVTGLTLDIEQLKTDISKISDKNSTEFKEANDSYKKLNEILIKDTFDIKKGNKTVKLTLGELSIEQFIGVLKGKNIKKKYINQTINSIESILDK